MHTSRNILIQTRMRKYLDNILCIALTGKMMLLKTTNCSWWHGVKRMYANSITTSIQHRHTANIEVDIVIHIQTHTHTFFLSVNSLPFRSFVVSTPPTRIHPLCVFFLFVFSRRLFLFAACYCITWQRGKRRAFKIQSRRMKVFPFKDFSWKTMHMSYVTSNNNNNKQQHETECNISATDIQ